MNKGECHKPYLRGRQYAALPPRMPHFLPASKMWYRPSFRTPIEVVRRDELGTPMLLDTGSPKRRIGSVLIVEGLEVLASSHSE